MQALERLFNTCLFIYTYSYLGQNKSLCFLFANKAGTVKFITKQKGAWWHH